MKKTFAEQVDQLTFRYGRRTVPLQRIVEQVALALGGQAGQRLLAHLSVAVSGFTLLRQVKELHVPARGLRKDLAAVTAGLSQHWNSGPVEGAVTRIKLLKRQSYGRASFDLLRRRILLANMPVFTESGNELAVDSRPRRPPEALSRPSPCWSLRRGGGQRGGEASGARSER